MWLETILWLAFCFALVMLYHIVKAAHNIPRESPMALPINGAPRTFIEIDFDKLPKPKGVNDEGFKKWVDETIDQVKHHYEQLEPGEAMIHGTAIRVYTIMEPLPAPATTHSVEVHSKAA